MDLGFAKIPSVDERLVQNKPLVAVEKGASSVSAQPFNALTQSSSQHVFSIIVPSLNTVIDRYLQLQTTMSCQFTLSLPSAPASASPIIAGQAWSIAAFPYHRLMSSTTCAINDVSVTSNYSQMLQSLLRVSNSKRWRKTCTTPSALTLAVASLTGTPADPYGNLGVELYGASPNAAFAFKYLNPNDGTVLTGSGSYTVGTVVQSVTVQYINGVPQYATGQTAYPLAVQYTVTEPYLQSPFVFGPSAADYSTGLHGITSIQITSQIQSPANANIFHSQAGATLTNVAFLTPAGAQSPFSNSVALCNFLSMPIGLKVPAKNVVPFQEIVVYPFSQTNALAAGATANVFSNTVTLSQVPEKLVIQVRPTSAYTPDVDDWVLPVSNVSIVFDNASGLRCAADLADHRQCGRLCVGGRQVMALDGSADREGRARCCERRSRGSVNQDAAGLRLS